MSSVEQCVKQVVISGRRWRRIRVRYRKLLDSKSASEKSLEKAKDKLIEDTNRHERVIFELEKALLQEQRTQGKKKININWVSVFGGISAGAGFAAQVLGANRSTPPKIGPKTIDVEAEVKNVE